MKLLFYGLNYAPEPVGIGPFTTGLAEEMVVRGHDVRVVTGQPYYPEWKPLRSGAGLWSRSMEQGAAILRCPHYIPRQPSAVKRILHHASFALSSAIPMLGAIRFQPDIIFAIVPSIIALPNAVAAARLSGARLWVHVQDFEVEAGIATGMLPRSGRLTRLALAFERMFLRKADMVSSISPQMCVRLDRLGVDAENIYELRNWSNHMKAFSLPPLGDYRREWGLGDRKVALYSGNIGNKQGLELIVETARLLTSRKDLTFIICGTGPYRAKLEERAAGLPNIQFHALQPAERMGELLSLTYVHVLPQLADAADLVLPSKLTNMLASGRPVVATAADGTGLENEVAGSGMTVPPGDARALADAIVELADDPQRADALGRHAARRAYARWSSDRIMDGAERAMLRLIARNANRADC